MLNIMNRVRLYHALLAILAIAAYLTGEIDPAHAWLGYGVAFVIVLRLLWALGGERQVGLMRFYPKFEGLKLKGAATHPAISRVLMLGIALSLLTVTGTGIAMDQGRSIGLQPASAERTYVQSPAELRYAGDGEDDEHEDEEDGEEGPLSEIHELAGNLLLAFVGMHVAYLLVFKRPLAKFMLFLPRAAKRKPEPPTSA
ncbi:cytochrome b/b6 domain-containing protein [Hyphomonas sp.]|uniref:cytochrome b/b6 domain-containing protein n=1 Tax=Hyphomonas sp. TaxID=87 RepID=UPI0025B844CA|nr:cytochrome b/b6 domain-containing protein [Hyphomonas sp.]